MAGDWIQSQDLLYSIATSNFRKMAFTLLSASLSEKFLLLTSLVVQPCYTVLSVSVSVMVSKIICIFFIVVVF